ncbi:microcephalin, partial [Garra rufa]|uniref:microcephalin n=1 Tax=Garra rufa TaxID=137080 RepID=UPI003CCE9144
SQMLEPGSGCDSPLRPSLGASSTLSFLQNLEEEPLDCFTTSHYHSSKKRDEQEKHNCHKKMTSKPKKQTPPEADTAMVMCNLAGIETNSKVSPISSRSRWSLVNNTRGKKQSTLESYINKTCSERKQSSHLKSQTEHSEISLVLSASPKRPKCSLPESLTKINHKNSKTIQQSKKLQTNSKRLYSKMPASSSSCFTETESDGSVTPKPALKFQHQVNSVGVLPSRDLDDGEVFEDYFSPANNALKQRVVLFGSTSEKLHMPTFDLEESEKRKGKKLCGKKRKHETIDIKELVGLSDLAPETHEPRPESLSVKTSELLRFEEIKLEASSKKPRTETRLSSAGLSVGKKRKTSTELSPANEKKTSMATSPVSSSVVNVKQIENCLETGPDPKTAVKKRRMSLKIVGKENESTTDGSVERSPEMSSKQRNMKKDKYMKVK